MVRIVAETAVTVHKSILISYSCYINSMTNNKQDVESHISYDKKRTVDVEQLFKGDDRSV